MKKVLSLGLLLVFLFNVGGYYIVFWGLRLQSDHNLSTRLDANQYDEAETIELKIPVSLPYPIYEQDFQRVDGGFEHDGEHLKMIKHKYKNDTLYIVCIRDVETGKLVETMNSYLELTQGLDGTSSDQKALNYLSKLLKDFYSHYGIILEGGYGFSINLLRSSLNQSFLAPALPIHAPPPRG